MKLSISTTVNQSWAQVTEGFTEKLFLSLNPPFPPVKLLRFDGCHKGDVVALELNFLLFKQNWDSLITSDETGTGHFQFVDEGAKLPFFLRRWVHRHRIEQSGEGTTILDAIEFSTGTWLTDVLFWPVLYGQFAYRIPIYKRFFR
jgi:ligand-binding SRPBCC domain-containing protein